MRECRVFFLTSIYWILTLTMISLVIYLFGDLVDFFLNLFKLSYKKTQNKLNLVRYEDICASQ